MQDIHSIKSHGGGARLFAGGGDGRLRPLHDHHQDLKCPRCDSLNTKFCYYNNYNLSQPRHFCKSCRRYWTKGGVLRNVPVGGGIRKTKRSKSKSKKSAVRSSDAAAAVPRERKSSNSENSSSDSSSLTGNTMVANTTATTIPITTTEVSGSNSTNSTSTLLNFNESSTRFFNIRKSSAPSTAFDPLMLNQSSAENILSGIGTFTSLMTSSTDQLPLGFNSAADTSSFPLHQQDTQHVVENQNPNQLQWIHSDVKMQEMGSVRFMDQTAEIELPGLESRRSNGGLAGTDDWQSSADQALFDLTGTVDQSYWSQSQWNADDHDHYLP